MTETNNERNARTFCEAIQKLAENKENLYNLESYLTSHFDEWLEKYANTPECLAVEMRSFAEMEL